MLDPFKIGEPKLIQVRNGTSHLALHRERITETCPEVSIIHSVRCLLNHPKCTTLSVLHGGCKELGNVHTKEQKFVRLA